MKGLSVSTTPSSLFCIHIWSHRRRASNLSSKFICYVHVCVNFPYKGATFFGVIPACGELGVGATSSGVQWETLNPSFFKLFLCVYSSSQAVILYWWDCRCMITKTCPLSKCCISLKSMVTNSSDFISSIRNSLIARLILGFKFSLIVLPASLPCNCSCLCINLSINIW